MKTKLGLNKVQKSTHQSLTKPFGKKLMSFVLCICMLIGIMVINPQNAEAQTITISEFNQKIQELKKLYPEKSYWNGSYNGKSWQCYGWAETVCAYIFNDNPRNWVRNYDLDNIRLGVHLRYPYKGYGHSMVVTGISGNTVTISDCNWVRNTVTWDRRTYTISELKNLGAWYYASNNSRVSGGTQTEPVHTHSWNYNYDSGHPHNQYRSCSCGAKEYTGSRQNIAGCANCFPVGNVSLTRSFNKVNGTATFYRNNVENAHSYTLTLYRDGYQYGNYNMSGRSYSVSGLAPGNYSAELTARNNNTGRTRKGYCSNFKIVNTYNVSFNANGGSNAPSAQTKIQNEWLTLSSSKPSRSHYIFKGWASSRTASEPQYQPGGTYDKNAKITLYAVWEPEVYTVNFDADGGKGDVSDRTITYGDTMKMPNGVIKDGYYLKGWATKKGAKDAEYKFGVDYKIDKNLSLYAVWGNSTWTEEVASSFAGGDGTEQNPYRISNAAELAYLAKIVNTQSTAPEYKYYVLTDNINLGYSEWTPIGIFDNENQYFCGSLDGNGYTISELYISGVATPYIGLFGYATNSVFKNIPLAGTIEGIQVSDNNYYYNIGGMCGYTEKTDFTDCKAAFFNIAGVENNSSRVYVGCLAGRIYWGNIINCKAEECSINFKSGNYTSGILVGCSNSTKISDCSVSSTESGLFSASSNINTIMMGGICGDMGGTIERCSVSAPYFANTLQIKSMGAYFEYVGGLCGYVNGTVRACSVQFNNGPEKTINGEDYKSSIYVMGDSTYFFIGGIVGKTGEAEIVDCKYNGQSITNILTSDGHYYMAHNYIGGIAGVNSEYSDKELLIKRCIANVDGILYGETAVPNIGGVLGSIDGEKESRIESSLAIAKKIDGRTTKSGEVYKVNKGYIVGINEGQGQISSTYYGSDVELPNNGSQDVINTEGTARSTRLMKMPSFLKNQLGYGEYVSVENLKENPDAVWVIRDGQLPELYYNCLNDITVSKDMENGGITVDKTQAVDGETVTITATPNDGYELNSVYVNGVEIDGTAFEMSGACDVYATFKPITPEYNVKVQTDGNAAATLVNMDKDSGGEISLMSVGDTELTARDGEEIKVNASAIDDYTVDGVYVNGEEIAADSFIVTDNSTVSLDVQSLSTDVKAVTNDVEGIDEYEITFSGSVSGDEENAVRYIKYWCNDDPTQVYTTEPQNGAGEYSVKIPSWYFEPEKTYSYSMTDGGNIKTFSVSPGISGDDGDPVTPQKDLLTTTVCTKTVDGYHFDITADESITDEIMVAIYNADDMVIDIKYAEVSGGKAAADTTQSTAKYAKIFVWESGMKPKAAPERVTVQ